VIKSRKRILGGHVALICEIRNAYKILVGKPEEKRPRGRPRHRWEDNIRMDLEEIGWELLGDCIWLGIGTSGGHL
jgi:hypothetical protein